MAIHVEDDLAEQTVPPAGGWGSIKSVVTYLTRELVPAAALKALAVQNKTGGFMCVSCAWAKPEHPHTAEFCENGAKATAWELTSKRRTPEFFFQRSLSELESWTDHALEEGGRLTAPMRWDPATDRYVEVSWERAFDEIAAELKKIDPQQAVFYTSGRASLEASYLYQLFARAYGHNNLPDSSNMCHESTSVALPKSIGVPIGTVWLEDFRHADCILFFGQNVGVNSPRMLHDLQDARRRGVPIITFNPMVESGLKFFDNPQSPHDMLLPGHTQVSTQYLQVRPGGDIAALAGLCKYLIERDDAALADGGKRVLDTAFIAEHTHGFDDLAAVLRELDWRDIEYESGLARVDLEQAAATYAAAKAVIAVYGMGLTQHREGVSNVNMLVNLLLMRGNIGRAGAGICPVRGHSNVQGQRTVGITEKPKLAPLDKLKELYGFEPPRTPGRTTVKTCAGVIDGEVKAFIGLGGNFLRAAPDTRRLEDAWRRLRLTVQVATKLNRSHVIHGEVAYLLPCLGRSEFDRQASGLQIVTTEDSTGHMHASHAVAEPASTSLLSEVAIVAGIAQRTLPANPRLTWREWTDDYALIRDAIAKTWPEIFHDFNERMDTPGGFPRPNAARERHWKTENGKANFSVPARWTAASDDAVSHEAGVLRLVTVRSDDQFNTTVYSDEDRLRRVQGRKIVLMNGEDMADAGLEPGSLAALSTVFGDGIQREVAGLRVIRYDLPRGCLVGYFPELNALVPLGHHAKESEVPAGKSIPVRVRAMQLAGAVAS
ncbi:FdhF/YdeP family oxidoreductase [Paucibacter sp. R3-3]|uniref:FdhF/YdeP family oxidoreductase n=1 Tax=Roseateles agri TaxID=3098619 RepID=A0ABU5DR98_9BURK|nr:FdhF/YdeP family oxidoreductase [Paucibacter sp. R3-3]MDY0747567.1 FdhF/YdeP family oxidoreductase [Paucibacter sp. R3-3]